MQNTDTTEKNSTKTTRRGARRVFTLIEILIVVVILGVLAALVIPGVTGALDGRERQRPRWPAAGRSPPW